MGKEVDAERNDSPVVHGLLLGVCLIFTWLVSTFTSEWMSYEHYGVISGIDLGRVILVSLDLYFAGSTVNSLLDRIKRPITETHHRMRFAAACVVAAFALHYTGTLTKVYAALGLRAPGPIASIGMLKSNPLYDQAPNLPLEAFAGDWHGIRKGLPPFAGWGAGWISRARVSVVNGEARVQIWRSCPPDECDGGIYPAIIESRRRGTAVALHVTGTSAGTDWLMTLSTQPDHMMLEEQHNRGRDRSSYHQYFDWMLRPGDRRLQNR